MVKAEKGRAFKDQDTSTLAWQRVEKASTCYNDVLTYLAPPWMSSFLFSHPARTEATRKRPRPGWEASLIGHSYVASHHEACWGMLRPCKWRLESGCRWDWTPERLPYAGNARSTLAGPLASSKVGSRLKYPIDDRRTLPPPECTFMITSR